jgi:hypothetical protein
MTQLYSDLVDGSGRRYYFALNRATGGLSPATQAALTVTGQQPTVFQQVSVFRNPAQATLTLFGYQPPALTSVLPGVGSVSLLGLVPVEQKIRIITNALPAPDYSTPNELVPTIVYIQTITPAPAPLQVQPLTLNVTPGGDIAYITPGVGLVQTQGLQATLINSQPNIGGVSIAGLIPTMKGEILLQPDVATITINGQSVSADRGFVWTTVVAPAPMTWTTTTGVAA